MKTVFHVSTVDQLSYVDAKVTNLLDDESVSIEAVSVVVDGSSVIDAAAGHLRGKVDRVLDRGAAFEVCSNALRGAESGMDELPDGAGRVPSGVGQLTRLQGEGYAYVRP